VDKFELFNKWIAALFEGLEKEVDQETRKKILEYCGRICATHHRSIETVKSLKKNARDIDDLLGKINRQKDFWCGKWLRENDIIYSICEKCGCPMVIMSVIELRPLLCECSRGWVRAVFEAALGKPVEVKLEKAIGRGDSICKYIVRIKE